MNKTMEYMAFGLPVVAFDLVETRVSAGDAAVYADPVSGAEGFAAALVDLVEHPDSRAVMGLLGRERVETALAWRHQAPAYLGVYDALTGRLHAVEPVERVEASVVEVEPVRHLVDRVSEGRHVRAWHQDAS
jgi:hypothetical protein